MCAGQGRDLIGALGNHPCRLGVRARLVELDERNVTLAQAAADAGLSGLEITVEDASNTSSYAGAVPADLILACGMLGIEFHYPAIAGVPFVSIERTQCSGRLDI